ncbi:MAG: hemin uptake protein HemP [Alphaproteobacteria bacterium]|nr:hemin uptake protein HemP [Alphaproteobacteria bacterium]
MATPSRPTEANAGQGVPDDRPPAIDSRTLLAGHRVVMIEHGTVVYRLRLTSNNKLILIK